MSDPGRTERKTKMAEPELRAIAPSSDAPPKPFQPHTLEYLVGPGTVATISFRCREGVEWDADTLGRVIMALEMQRNFLTGNVPTIGVSISTARPGQVQESPGPKQIEGTTA